MKSKLSLRQALLVTAAAFGAVGFAAVPDRPAYAQEAQRTYNIRAQSLDAALREFGLQSGRDVLYAPAIVAGRRSPGARGSLSEAQALNAILAGSGLRYTRTASGGYAIQPAAGPLAGETVPASDEAPATTLPEILVSGSRSLNVDIRRTEDDAQPYVVFGGDEVRNSGAANADEFLRRRLPSNTQRFSMDQVQPGLASETGNINLRGLGTDETLILVDGRRVPNAGGPTQFLQPSITGIPTAAIERIEILPASASGIYGGNATGGVINIVLKRDYSGWDVQSVYGNSFDSDTGRLDLSFTGGFTFNEGRTRVTLTGARRTQNALELADRDFTRRARELALANNPNVFNTGFLLPDGATGNICSAAGATPTSITCLTTAPNLVLDPQYGSHSLNSRFTSIPLGYAGPGQDGAAALLANAGRFNLDAPRDRTSISASDGESVSLDVRHRFSGSVDAYVSVQNDRQSEASPQGESLYVNLPANHPNNPFQQNIVVNVPLNAGPKPRRDNEMLVARAGLILQLSNRWTAGAEYAWSRSISAVPFAETTLLPYAAPALSGAPLAYLQSIALTDTAAFPADLTLLDRRAFISGPWEVELQDVALRASGPIARLPGGPIVVSGLAQFRSQNVGEGLNGFLPASISGAVTPIAWIPEKGEDVYSAYLETRVPLFSSANALPFVRDLELMASVRHDEYKHRLVDAASTSFAVPSVNGPFPTISFRDIRLQSTDYTVGLRYAPTEDVVLRASYGTGFLPPNLSQYTSFTANWPAAFSNLYRDPLRANSPTPANVVWTLGGNSSVEPERSASLSYGLIFTPRWIENFRLSVDYVEIEKEGELVTPDVATIIANEALFPGRVTRGPLTPADTALGYTGGPITGVNTSLINAATSKIQAWDVRLDYRLETERFGVFRPYLIATHQTALARRALPTSAEIDIVGFADGPLEWRGNAGIAWDYGPWNLEWNAQFYDDYHPCNSTAISASCATTIATQGSDRIPAQTYHDLFVGYRFDQLGVLGLQGAEVRLAIENLFDRDPPLTYLTNLTTAPGISSGATSTLGDARGRRFILTLRTRF